MVKLEMLVNGLPDYGTDVHDVNYAEVARAIGFTASASPSPVACAERSARGLRIQRPALIEVMTDPNALSLPPEIRSGQVIGFDRNEQDCPQPRRWRSCRNNFNMRNIPRL